MMDAVAAVVDPSTKRDATRETNRLALSDRAVHDWYRFVLSYPRTSSMSTSFVLARLRD
jgi:hypothetical protein